MKLISRILASKFLRWGFIVLALGVGTYYVFDQWGDIYRALDRIGPAAALGSLAFDLLSLGATLMLWRGLMAALGSPLPVGVASRILFVGQLGKYLPGAVWPVLAQMEMATEHKVPRSRTAAASVLTMVTPLLAALLIGLVTLPFIGGATRYWWAFLIAVPLVACLYPPLLNRLLGLAFKILRRSPLEQPLTARTIATAMGWSFVSWIFYGLQIWVLMVAAGARPLSALPLAIGAFAFAFVVGFVIVFAPAGAGFREVLLAALMAPMVGTHPAAAITLVSRVATTLADVIVAGSAVYAYRRAKKRAGLTPPPQDEERPAVTGTTGRSVQL